LPAKEILSLSLEETNERAVFPHHEMRRGTLIAIPIAEVVMKKIFALLMTITILAAVAAPTFGQGRGRRNYYEPAPNSRDYYDNSRARYDDSRAYYDYGYRDRSVWDRHRDKLSLAIGAGSGAVIGGLFGGKRGAAIGAVSGLGASALYTYKLRKRGNRY
jgi:hypothetical protein